MEYKGNKTFLFNWNLKNVCWAIDRIISSPRFVVEALNNTEWHLELENGKRNAAEHMRCHLRRDHDNGPESVDVEFEISMNCDGENPPGNAQESRFSFQEGDRFFLEEFALRQGLFKEKYANFTISCRMWTRGTEFVGVAQCSARTLIAEKFKTFEWAVEDVSPTPVSPTISLASSPEEEGPSLTLKMILKNETYYRVGGFKVNVKGIDSDRVLMLTCATEVFDVKEKTLQDSEFYDLKTVEGVSDYQWHIPIYICKQCLAEKYPGSKLLLKMQCQFTIIEANEIRYPSKRSCNIQKSLISSLESMA